MKLDVVYRIPVVGYRKLDGSFTHGIQASCYSMDPNRFFWYYQVRGQASIPAHMMRGAVIKPEFVW